RLTSNPGLEFRAKFSPDGKWIAFSGQYDGYNDVYVMPSEGGEPKRLTYDWGPDLVTGWTPDGKIAYVTDRERVRPDIVGLWEISPDGGFPTKTDVHEAYDVSFSPDGRTIAYNRVSSQNFNWRHYRGGTQGKVSFWDFTSHKYSEMATGREQNYYPMWVGNDVYYVSDLNDNTLNLYRYDVKSKSKTQLTKFTDGDIRWPGTDGKTIVYERNGHMYTYALSSGKIDEVSAQVAGDQLSRRPYYKNVADFIDGMSISPSGKRLAITARGDLFTVPAENGETRDQSDTPGAREESPTWSPDGQEIAFISDKSGERKIYRMPQMGGEWKMVPTTDGDKIESFRYSPDGKMIGYRTLDYVNKLVDLETGKVTTVFQDPQGDTSTDFSPDGKWIAYIQTQPNLFGAVYLYDVANDKHYKVTDGFFNDSSVTFDLNGKYLYIVSARAFAYSPSTFEVGLQQVDTQRVYVLPLKADMKNPLDKPSDEEPVKATGDDKKPEEKKDDTSIDVDGLAARTVALPLPPGNYNFVIGANNGVFTYSNGSLMKFDFASKKADTIITGASQFDFTPDRTKFAYGAGPVWGISAVHPGVQPGAGRVSMGDVNMTIDPVTEWKQMVREGWRYERDQYYDKNMHGLDWPAVGAKYEKMVESAGDRSDVNYIIGMMIGELGTGHAYVIGGDFGQPIGNPTTGSLGADYEVVGDHIAFKRVLRGHNYESFARGPLGAPGVDVKDGDVLLEIDGQKVTADMDPDSLLVGKIGKDVTIKVASGASGVDARTYTVKPIGSESQLRYFQWVDDNRKRVDELSGGKIGYVHVPDTQFSGITEFMKAYYALSDKKAFIVDERYNHGGFVPTFFGERLTRLVINGIQSRHGENILYPPQTWDGPKAMLINRYAGSGGDHFPWLFRHLKIGPLIGTRTWGGLVGLNGFHMFVDGGGLTAPGFALYSLQTGQIIAENKGIDPDITVDDTPDLVSQGHDPELEAAVKYLLDELAKHPAKPYTEPQYLKGGGN
ncbi:MAG TPA: S41 family peptidase, partial [Fimbriimonadaceae bacterium]|nr:S41 family peptidase [Fimbriimonadaceae bacterium]